MNDIGSGPALALLAEEACAMTLATIPDRVLRQVRLCILDTVGCVLAGARTAEARLIAACEAEFDGEPRAMVMGTGMRRSLVSAIRINGYMGDVLELNDLIAGHASIGNVSAALALADVLGAPGAALVEAVVRGIETTARVYAAAYPTLRRFTEVGMVPVGMPSAIGAAAVAARLLGFDQAKTLEAMAIAGGMAGWCPAEVIFGEGGTMKPLLFGAQPAEAGVTAALYARNGMTGPRHLLDSKVGYFATASTAGRLERGGEPRTWALAQPRRKLHACCGYIHSAADAAARVRARLPTPAPKGEWEIHVAPYVADVVSKAAPPTSPNDARFHLQYCLALVLCGHDVIRPEHSIDFATYLKQDGVFGVMTRIRVVSDPGLTHYHHSIVIFRAENGQQTQERLSAPRGSPQEPLSDEDVIGKFLVLASPVIGEAAALDFVERISRLETAADSREVLRPLATCEH